MTNETEGLSLAEHVRDLVGLGPTRRQMQIARALANKGYSITSMEWSPIGGMVEMQGREGGWFVFADPGDRFVGGFNVAEVLAQIADLPAAGAGS